MKKVLTCIIALLLIVSMVACENNNNNNSSENENNFVEKTNDDSSVEVASSSNVSNEIDMSEDNSEETIDLTKWGIEDTFPTDDGQTIDRYSIRLPRYKGTFHKGSKISEQPDGTVVLLSGQDIDTPKVDDVKDIFSTYVDYTIESLTVLYGIQSSNYKISIDKSEAVTIGDKDMYVHEGVITYDFDGTQRSHKYVAYATLLQPSGNCAYWMVYDFSKDGSNSELIAKHALNMAKTFIDE